MQYLDFLISRSQLEAVFPELKEQVQSQRLKQIRLHPGSLSFQFAQGYLRLALSPAENYIALSAQRPDETLEPSPFVMLLRKYLKGRFLQTVHLSDTDRVLDLCWADHTLRLEMTGRHCNGFLLDAAGVILGSYRPTASYRRRLEIGQPYPWPLPTAIAASSDPLNLQALPTDGSRSEALMKKVSLIQQHNQLLQQWQALKRPVQRTLKALQRECQKIEANRAAAEDRLQARQWGELLQGAYGHYKPGMSLISVVDYYQPEQPQRELPLDPALDLAANIARYFKLARRAERTLEHTEARLLTLWENLDTLENQKKDLQQSEAVFSQALTQQDFTLAADLVETGRIRMQVLGQTVSFKGEKQQAAHGAKKSEKRLPFRQFFSLDGCEIWVGKSARDNDELSLKLARGNDLWLHAHNWTGSHVIVRLKKNEQISEQSLLDAATLAAWYSQGKADTRIEVMYTPAKYVHKVKGSPPGQVQVSAFKTLTLKLEPERLQRLKQGA